MPKPKWTWQRIKDTLTAEGMTLTRLAELNELSPGRFRATKTYTNRKAEAAIAAFLGERVEDLFPDRYPIRTSKVLSSKYADPNATLPAHRRAA